MYPRADQFDKYLRAKGIQSEFQRYYVGDSVVYNMLMDLPAPNSRLFIVFDQSFFIAISANIHTIYDFRKRNKFIRLMNNYNYRYRNISLVIEEENDIVMRTCHVAKASTYSPQTTIGLTVQVGLEVKRIYPEFEQIIWS